MMKDTEDTEDTEKCSVENIFPTIQQCFIAEGSVYKDIVFLPCIPCIPCIPCPPWPPCRKKSSTI